MLTRFDSILLGDADWYRVQLTENDHDLFFSRDLTARISLEVADAPAQTSGDLDMQVFRANGTLVGQSSAGGTGDEVFDVKKSDTPFVIGQPGLLRQGVRLRRQRDQQLHAPCQRERRDGGGAQPVTQ